ncbi:hypothetical protein ONE63_009320 [Megalurothrips usitatus]|uniref:G-protein coupled receptors family 3 profile domain-containing protein n=1 Tax=Megalurothrips usitatus TaxID=439358 RepID=A0AAV7XKQ4_9NEOP|nr:hypothetical protein ONE63_009320 [Megalurothrips usitatus]
MGDGLARYDISNYQRAENSSGYVYKTVGWWSETLVLDVEALAWTNGTRSVPTSTCSEPCGVGMIKRHHKKGDVCCWICDTCEEYEYVYNESTCVDCGKGSWPYPDKRSCYELDVQYIPFFSPVAYGPLIVAASGVAFTLATVGVFVQYNDTPLVRATGRELSYALLMGITLCFANTFILLQKPSLLTCTVQRFSVGMGFCIIYSALLTKTNRISRIFDSASKSARRPKFISPKSQVLITVGLILVQTLGTFAWLVAEPPGTRFDYPDRRQVWLKCRINDESFLLSQLYNILLICVCTVYAFKTRKIPENFNESKFIVFTMYTTCVIWLAFLPIYFTTRHAQEVQALTLCVSISLSAWVSLGCLFAPKVYIILFHPEKNVRRLTMSTTYRRRSGGGRASSSGVPTATTALAEHHDHNNRGSGHYQACTPVGQAVDLVVSQSPGPTASTSTNVVEGHEAAALL